MASVSVPGLQGGFGVGVNHSPLQAPPCHISGD